MKLPLKWLNEYVDISSVSVETLKNGLFSCGFEVEEVIEINKDVKNIVTCKILSKTKHPQADSLFVCSVDAGSYGVLQIVTNAVNVSEGDIVPVALSGAVLADGTQIKNGKLRGVESFGMFCGGEEIGITDATYEGASGDSVLIFKDNFELGKQVSELLDIKETVFDIAVTANRPDCQSVLGLAREVAALLNKKLNLPKTDYITSELKVKDFVDVKVLDNDLCPRYIASYVDGIKIEPSPKWMRKRLELMGIHPINNVVDITNYVLCEIGQPMHAFDYRELEGGKIVVRRAKKGEKIVTLDEKEFSLTEENLVICDKDKPSALAGVMGGLGSGIKSDTNTLVFESAKFKRDNIRKTSRTLSQRSDSSARYEKGVDAYTTELGMKRALHLICELKVGKIAEGVIDINASDMNDKIIKTKISKINSLLGIEVPSDKIIEILSALDFKCILSNDDLTVTVPSYREDIEGYPDLAEEIIRFYGYDHIECSLFSNSSITSGGRNSDQVAELFAKKSLAASGYNEIISYSFISPKDYADFGMSDADAIKIKNPLGEDVSLMRTTLIPSLVSTAKRNINKQNSAGKIYELAKIYLPTKANELPCEKRRLVLACYGEGEDFFTLKGVVEKLFVALGYNLERTYTPSKKEFLHPTRSADILCGGECIGFIGQLNPLTGEKIGFDKPIFIAEINYEEIKDNFTKNYSFVPYSKYPSSERDLALVIDDIVTNATIIDTIKSANIKTLKDIKLFDVYKGDRIQSGKKSMAYRLTFSSQEKTLEVEEIERCISKILKRLTEIGAELR